MDPLPAVAAPRRGRPPPPPPQQYPYNPTPNVVTNQYGIEQWFRNAFITKVIVLFTIIYYFLQQQQQYSTGSYHRNSRNSSESHIAVWNTLLRPHSNSIFQYLLSKMIFMRSHHAMNSSSSSYNNSSNDASSTTIVLLWMNVWYQWYLYRWLERQMSSYQLVRFLLFVVLSTILLEYTIMSYSLNTDAVAMRPWIVPSSSSSYTIYGPYSTIGAVSLYYHWYRPRLYPRFVTIASIYHLSEKSLFYFYTIYFIIIHYNNSTSSSSNNSYNNDHGAIHVMTSMCMGMGLAIVYVTLSNHPKICYYDQWIHDRIRRQSILQRYFPTHPTTPRTGTTARIRNPTNVVQHRGGTTTTVPQPPPSSSSQLRQRTTTAANMTATGSDPNQHRNNPWTIPGVGGGGVNHNNNIDVNETDPNVLGGTGGMEEDTMMTTTIPLLPHDQVDPDAVEQLCRMGFERAPVVLALRQSHNNIEHAAHRLLSSTTG